MKMCTRIQFLMCFLGAACHSAQIPSYFKRCFRRQIDFDECFKLAGQNAVKYLNSPIKELGLPNLDPLEVPQMNIGVGTGPVAFTQDYVNVKLFGLSTANCTESKIDFEKKILFSRCKTPEIKMVFDYEFKGRILVLPLYGKGSGTTTLFGINNNLTFYLDEYEKRGQKHFKVVNCTFTFTPERMVFNFDNLFGKDEALNENMNKVFNDNWQALYNDVGKSYEHAFAQVFASIFNHMMEKLSISDLFGDE